MIRPVVSSEADALRDLGTPLSCPAWPESSHSLPLGQLRWDEFEVFCYLLLLREKQPGEEVVYHGKTVDFGRDIVRRYGEGRIELIQCKRYNTNVGLRDVRAELAKLFVNLFSNVIPEKPTRISFYVTPDLTSPARKLLSQDEWVKAAEKALSESQATVSPALLEFALTWWPPEGVHAEPAIQLADRAEHYPELVDKFFRVRKVIDGSAAELRAGFKADLQEVVRDMVGPRTPAADRRNSETSWSDFLEGVCKVSEDAIKCVHGIPKRPQ